MKKDRYYRSASFPLANFLTAKGENVINLSPTGDYSKKEFVFISTIKLEKLVNLFKFGERDSPELLVPVHKYEQSRRELLDRLNS